ncbi:MAG TPA: DUF4349 domain-containing protein [Solirubrobacterales bacterium]|jgi:hypothetical protein
MEPRREDTDLATELRELRPAPRPEFAAELDARAAAGFPGANGEEAGPSLPRRLAERLARVPRWRVPALAGSVAVAAIAVATAVIALSEEESVRPTAQRPVVPWAGVQFRPAPPPESLKPFARRLPRSREAAAAEGTAASAEAMNFEGAAPLRASGPNAFLTSKRDVERSARLVLATEPSEVRTAAARVFETVHSYNGIVLRSSIAASDGAEASAVFELLIPSGRLGDALAGFSEIAEVRSRHDSTGDVTGRTTGLEERLRDSSAKIEGLLAELANADTEAERSAAEARLRSERRRLAALRSALQNLERRVNLSRVSLRIESGSPGSDAGDGSWSVSDAFDDAGRILAIAAGVTLIGLAVLAPFALVVLLAWAGSRLWLRRKRDRILD